MGRDNFIISINLHKMLKNKFKGKIFITIQDGTLTVNINSGRGIFFRHTVNNIDTYLDLNKLVDDIEYEYRKFLNDVFFIKY